MSDGYWFRQRYDDAEFAMTEGMTSPVRCRHCRRVYDLGKVEVVARYTDCSMWRCPGCKILADDRKPPWGIQHYDELPRRNQAFPVADEDADFADEWDDADSNAYQDRVEAGLEGKDSSDEDD